MAGLFNILKVTVSEDKICAHVLVNPGMPLMTSEDIEATARVYYLVPAIAKHLCLGDSGREFQDCMGQTELCHLLEHVTVELMNETGLAGSISCGRTRVSEHDERVFEVDCAVVATYAKLLFHFAGILKLRVLPRLFRRALRCSPPSCRRRGRTRLCISPFRLNRAP